MERTTLLTAGLAAVGTLVGFTLFDVVAGTGINWLLNVLLSVGVFAIVLYYRRAGPESAT